MAKSKKFIFFILFIFLFISSILNAQSGRVSVRDKTKQLERYDYIISNRNTTEYNFYLACIQNNYDFVNKSIAN